MLPAISIAAIIGIISLSISIDLRNNKNKVGEKKQYKQN